MKALEVAGPQSLGLVEHDVQVIGENDALVRTAVAAICHTDHYLIDGTHPSARYPVTPGHEFSGTVEAIGKDVRHLVPGARVAVQTILPCLHCRHCRHGRINLCADGEELGRLRAGGFAEYVVVPAYALHPIENGFSFEKAALTEPSANAHALVRSAEIGTGDVVAVIGPGPIGLLALQYALLKNPSRTILIGLPHDQERLALGKQLGATDTLSVLPEEAVEAIEAWTNGRGVDRVLQCAPSVDATGLALAIAGLNANVVIEGVAARDASIPVKPDELLLKQITLRGVRGWMVPDFVTALEINQSGRVDVAGLITHRFRLEEYQAAFELTAGYRDGVVKAVFDFGSHS
jgi:L-iditol 2-dehydrogenase